MDTLHEVPRNGARRSQVRVHRDVRGPDQALVQAEALRFMLGRAPGRCVDCGRATRLARPLAVAGRAPRDDGPRGCNVARCPVCFGEHFIQHHDLSAELAFLAFCSLLEVGEVWIGVEEQSLACAWVGIGELLL